MPYVELYLSNVYFSRFEAQSFEVYLSYTSFKLTKFCLIIVNQACDFFGLLLPVQFSAGIDKSCMLFIIVMITNSS